LKGAGDVLLADDLGEFLGAIFAGQDGVTHGRKRRLYVMGRVDFRIKDKSLNRENAENCR
jgi:hypothetical protein